MKTKKSKKLNLKDRLSRLTYVSTCQLLGEHGKELLKQSSAIDDIDVDRDVYLGGDLFRLKLRDFELAGDAVVTITYAVVVFSILVQGLTINRGLAMGEGLSRRNHHA